MVDKIKINVKQNSTSSTQYITIPVVMVTDSQYPFTKGETVEIKIISKEEGLIVRKIKI